MTRCDWLTPLQGWRQGDTSETVIFEDRCGYAEAHPEIMSGLPGWLVADLLAAPGWRPHHCIKCRCNTALTTENQTDG
jgi:hypothetical protein